MEFCSLAIGVVAVRLRCAGLRRLFSALLCAYLSFVFIWSHAVFVFFAKVDSIQWPRAACFVAFSVFNFFTNVLSFRWVRKALLVAVSVGSQSAPGFAMHSWWNLRRATPDFHWFEVVVFKSVHVGIIVARLVGRWIAWIHACCSMAGCACSRLSLRCFDSTRRVLAYLPPAAWSSSCYVHGRWIAWIYGCCSMVGCAFRRLCLSCFDSTRRGLAYLPPAAWSAIGYVYGRHARALELTGLLWHFVAMLPIRVLLLAYRALPRVLQCLYELIVWSVRVIS